MSLSKIYRNIKWNENDFLNFVFFFILLHSGRRKVFYDFHVLFEWQSVNFIDKIFVERWIFQSSVTFSIGSRQRIRKALWKFDYSFTDNTIIIQPTNLNPN